MTTAQWNNPGATLSHKNASKEFGLAEQEIVAAIQVGKLQHQVNYAHGNPYLRLLRSEVEKLAIELRGASYLERQRLEFELKSVSRQINSLKRKLNGLEREVNSS